MTAPPATTPLPTLGDASSTPLPITLRDWTKKLPKEVHTIIDTVAEHGGGIWIVGGAVRDAYLRLELEVQDIDFAVSFPPAKMLEFFPDAIPTGIDYGTVSYTHLTLPTKRIV